MEARMCTLMFFSSLIVPVGKVRHPQIFRTDPLRILSIYNILQLCVAVLNRSTKKHHYVYVLLLEGQTQRSVRSELVLV